MSASAWLQQGFPAPVSAAQEAREDRCPRAALTALRAAQSAGWDARLTYACGTRPDSAGAPAAEKTRVHFAEEDVQNRGKKYQDVPTGRNVLDESIALRASHSDGRAFIMVWVRQIHSQKLNSLERTGFKLDCAWTNKGQKIGKELPLKAYLES